MSEQAYIRFKTTRIRDEWESNALHPALRVLVFVAARWHFLETGQPAVITSLLRTREEQQAIYPDQPGKRSVHEFGRGADLRTAHISQSAKILESHINICFPYTGKANVKSALVHDVGRGDHIHLQVSPLEPIPSMSVNLVV